MTSEIEPFCYLVQNSSERNPPHGWAVHFTDGEIPLYTADAIESLQAECDRLRSENRDLRDVLIRGGFVPCGVPACNCGSWHHRFGYPERFREIEELLQDNDVSTNGITLLSAIKALVEERNRLRCGLETIESIEGKYLHNGGNDE